MATLHTGFPTAELVRGAPSCCGSLTSTGSFVSTVGRHEKVRHRPSRVPMFAKCLPAAFRRCVSRLVVGGESVCRRKWSVAEAAPPAPPGFETGGLVADLAASEVAKTLGQA